MTNFEEAMKAVDQRIALYQEAIARLENLKAAIQKVDEIGLPNSMMATRPLNAVEADLARSMRPKRVMSQHGREAIAAAQRARWARQKREARRQARG